MSLALRPLEVPQRNAALGLRFWDVAAATPLIDGLLVEVVSRTNPRVRKSALPNRSGVYVAHSVSGLHDFEFDARPPEQLWANATLHGYRVEVQDPHGRFLPLAFDIDLPVRDLYTWIAPWSSPLQPIALPGTTGSPPQLLIERVPLFSAPSRLVPEPLAVVYAQLRELNSQRVPAWGLLGVSIDGAQRGLGLADEQGRVAVMFPYPEPPRMPLASPPEVRSDFRWTVELSAFWSPPSPPVAAPAIPDLAEVLAQLAIPCTVIDSTSSPAAPRRLDYRVPMTARTDGLLGADASFLMVSTA